LIRVLHVDDDAGFLKTAKQILEMQGAFEVDTASSVEEALGKVKEKTFDVIVSDYQMPEKDGLDFLKELRDGGNNIPFIIFTGKSREEVAVKALNLGADRYINKIGGPETVYTELAHDIRQTVKKRRAEIMLRESEEKYRNLFENAKDVIILFDLKGNITSVNKVAVEYGFKKDEVIGKNITEFASEKYWPRLLKDLAEIAQGNSVEGEIEITTPKGNKTAGYTSNPIIIDNQIVGVQATLRDITQRRKAEEELIRLSNAVKMSTDSIVITDINGIITDANEAALKMHGIDDKRDLIGKSAFDTIAPESQERALADMKELLKKGYGKAQDYHLITKDGSKIVTEIGVTLLKDVDGKPTGFVNVIRDIAERKKAEEALRESEEKFRNIFEGVNDEILYLDKYGKIIDVNKRIEDIFGYKRDEVIGKNFTELGVLQPKDLPRMLNLFTTAIGKSEVVPLMELEIKDKKGNKVPVEASTRVIKKDGKIEGLLVIVRDITERKRTEDRIKASEEKYRGLVELAPDSIMAFDLNGVVTSCNDASARLSGYSKDELVGKHFSELGPLPERDVPKYMEMLGSTVKGKVPKPFEVVWQRKDGTSRFGEVRMSLLREKGEIAGFQAIMRDVTERRKTLKKLETINEKLGVVGKLTRHDVRNKLATVANNVYLAKQRLRGDPEALGHLSEIESACDQVERIFDFARIYEMLGAEELAYIDVEKSLKEAVMLHPNLKGVKVVNKCHGLTVVADSLVRQLFYNLIDNSLKHGEKVNRIKVYHEKAGKDKLKLVYEDDGVGISKAEKKKIFKEGYGKGSGYGLYLIRKMCEVYSWAIQETGKQGKGAQFTITIPKMNKSGKIAYRLH